MATAREVAQAFEEIAPMSAGLAGDQLGFIHGNPDAVVAGLGCMWCVHSQSLRYCAERGLNMIICHEALWLPAQTSPWYDGPTEERIFSNRVRREGLAAGGAVVYRSHSNWDGLRNIGIADSAVAALRLAEAKEIGRQRFFSVQELARPVYVEELKRIVERGLGFAGCRIFGDAGKQIRRFAFLIGGFGENQCHMPQAAMEMGAEAVIIGEMSEFIVIACLEMGLPVIESLHSVSEIPGIKAQAEVLAKRLHPLRVEYVPSGAMSFSRQI
ncbi:MAG TPA: Nif3-like dinuclear metal center hexameric protein [Candidatus Brocadiia bacterium]|nr:Nif3-like dinuclear metal center hexameric protein [Candidatus Brocadiia bacterium]